MAVGTSIRGGLLAGIPTGDGLVQQVKGLIPLRLKP